MVHKGIRMPDFTMHYSMSSDFSPERKKWEEHDRADRRGD